MADCPGLRPIRCSKIYATTRDTQNFSRKCACRPREPAGILPVILVKISRRPVGDYGSGPYRSILPLVFYKTSSLLKPCGPGRRIGQLKIYRTGFTAPTTDYPNSPPN